MTTGVLIADDENLIRKLFISALRKYEDLRIVGEASNGEEVLAILENAQPDVLLLDWQMPRISSLDVLKHIRAKAKQVKTIVVSMHDSDENIKEAISAGALGFLPKSDEWDDMYTAIKTVAKGEFYYSKRINSVILKMALEQKDNSIDPKKSLAEFNDREQSVIAYLIEGLGSAEIAEILFCSQSNVDRIRQELIHRVKAKNTAGLLRYVNKKN